jgi:acyl-CoA thioester hydrolase
LSTATGTAYPITIAFDVLWGDMDAFGHVNNARYFTWFESCRTVYFLRLGLRMDQPSPLGPIVASVSCDYLAPVVYPASLVAGVRVTKIGNTSFSMDYGLWKKDMPDPLLARGTSVVVLFDYVAQKKVRLPNEMRDEIAKIEASVGSDP